MKRSVLVFLMSLSFAKFAFAENIRTVEGVGKHHGYFQAGDDWSLHFTKNSAKRFADEDAMEKCSNLDGQTQFELASYTSTCKPGPRLHPDDTTEMAPGWFWHYCTVTVETDCRVKN